MDNSSVIEKYRSVVLDTILSKILAMLNIYEWDTSRLKALSNHKEKILVRRSKVIELYSQGLSEREMAKAVNIPRSTINLDVRVMRGQARTNVKTFVEDRLPFEHESLMTGIRNSNLSTALLNLTWLIIISNVLMELKR